MKKLKNNKLSNLFKANIGSEIREIRFSKQIDTPEICEKAGLTSYTLSRIENGVVFNLTSVLPLVDALGYELIMRQKKEKDVVVVEQVVETPKSSVILRSKKDIGLFLKAKRVGLGRTLDDHSKECGINRITINRIENGKSYSVDALFKLLSSYGLGMEFIQGVNMPDSPKGETAFSEPPNQQKPIITIKKMRPY